MACLSAVSPNGKPESLIAPGTVQPCWRAFGTLRAAHLITVWCVNLESSHHDSYLQLFWANPYCTETKHFIDGGNNFVPWLSFYSVQTLIIFIIYLFSYFLSLSNMNKRTKFWQLDYDRNFWIFISKWRPRSTWNLIWKLKSRFGLAQNWIITNTKYDPHFHKHKILILIIESWFGLQQNTNKDCVTPTTMLRF